MTKTLTEQWRDGTLDGGYYYLKMKDGNIFIDHTEYIFWAHEIRWETKDSSYVKEVLAPVPSYDEIVKLEKKLEIATKALKEYANCKPTEWMSCVTADKALKEMEGVK